MSSINLLNYLTTVFIFLTQSLYYLTGYEAIDLIINTSYITIQHNKKKSQKLNQHLLAPTQIIIEYYLNIYEKN